MILLKRAPIGIFLEDHWQCNDIKGFGIDFIPDLLGDGVGNSSDLVFGSGGNKKRDREKGWIEVMQAATPKWQWMKHGFRWGGGVGRMVAAAQEVGMRVGLSKIYRSNRRGRIQRVGRWALPTLINSPTNILIVLYFFRILFSPDK